METKKLSPAKPGEILQEKFLEPLGISQARLATDLNLPLRRITEIVGGTRCVFR
jgi:addiction module HigA family antidote